MAPVEGHKVDCLPQNRCDGEAYFENVRQVMTAAQWPWPQHVVMDVAKAPRFIHSVTEFMYELQYGCHVDQVVVFPGGVHALGQDKAIHPQIADALFGAGVNEPNNAAESGHEHDSNHGPDDNRTAFHVLERLSKTGILKELKGKVNYHKGTGDAACGHLSAGARGNSCLQPKWEALQHECPDDLQASVYLAEIRKLDAEESNVPGGMRSRRKSTLSTTMREKMYQLGLDVHDMIYWDDYSEGFFIGGEKAAYHMHVDCIQTSNVGCILSGHKLLALWSYPQETMAVLDKHHDTLFVDPLLPEQVSALEKACCVALAPPGSVYIFSGANAHVVRNVGFGSPSAGFPPSRSLCASSYEAFVGLNPQHVAICAGTHDERFHWKGCWMDEEDLEDFEEDVAKNLVSILEKRLDKKVMSGDYGCRAVEMLCNTCPRIASVVRKLVSKRHGDLLWPPREHATAEEEANTTSDARRDEKVDLELCEERDPKCRKLNSAPTCTETSTV